MLTFSFKTQPTLKAKKQVSWRESARQGFSVLVWKWASLSASGHLGNSGNGVQTFQWARVFLKNFLKAMQPKYI